ncbi:MAG TPA: aminotransferase class V-fold PLP-dependent enzyme [Candidatus Krumholzibacteria bacterium]|nr:aminotransferase class V-fold PLP-dependent enzyme [Candidatus Krumholzibacteria bacterium]HPD72682.1 aminotransferase class V-fold PLP-dependent enzyme [Candidatus Krumholzibacteria bacterium]HRY40386.1 aminotransferase class V-fold PLP-dependent enzyme [Candidatus Krumholzibacteria bacterium]
MVYLDNAATSWPKPPGVVAAMVHYLEAVGANPGRSGHHRSAEAGRIVLAARRAVAALCGVQSPMRVLLGPNATWALNQAIAGLLQDGDHVVTTSFEHNSVLRPLTALAGAGTITLTVVPGSADGRVDPDAVAAAITARTALVVVNHASNVCGAVQPVAEIGHRCRERAVPLLVDAAQSAGAVPLDLTRQGIALCAVAGHKGLLGPTGTGALVLADDFEPDRLRPLLLGGTGSRSDSLEQPAVLPDRFESGTLNVAGLAGLAASVEWLLGEGGGPEAIGRREAGLRAEFVALAEATVPGFQLVGPRGGDLTGVVSFRVAGQSVSDLAQRLDDEHGVLGRSGLHCAPAAHRALGTFPAGTLRFAFGAFNTGEQVEAAVAALAAIGERRPSP